MVLSKNLKRNIAVQYFFVRSGKLKLVKRPFELSMIFLTIFFLSTNESSSGPFTKAALALVKGAQKGAKPPKPPVDPYTAVQPGAHAIPRIICGNGQEGTSRCRSEKQKDTLQDVLQRLKDQETK